MTTIQKILGLTGIAYLYWLWKQPTIKVVDFIRVPGEPVGITYKMSVNGKTVLDTIYEGDETQTIPAGDNEHFFTAEPVETGVNFYITTKNKAGEIQTVEAAYIRFDYPLTTLPLSLV